MDDDTGYPSSFDPCVTSALEDTDRLLSDSQALLNQLTQQMASGNHPLSDINPLDLPPMSSDVDTVLDMSSHILREAQDVAAGKYTVEELKAMSARDAHRVSFLEGFNTVERVANEVSTAHQKMLDQDYVHNMRQMASDSEISGDSHLKDARAQFSQGESAQKALDAAARDFADAAHYDEQAEEYDPDKH